MIYRGFANAHSNNNNVICNYTEYISIYCTSSLHTFENLLSILPRGVVSKNDIGDLRILLNIPSWSLTDALREPMASENENPNTAKA